MSSEAKNAISHRGKALQLIKPVIGAYLNAKTNKNDSIILEGRGHMKVLLVSDSHGRNQNMEKVIRKVSPIDLLIHLGDLEGSEGYLEAIAPCPVEMVAGNNDFFSKLPRGRGITISRHQVFTIPMAITIM